MSKFEDPIICRCEEVTESEIREAIKNGATTVTATKRITRAGMGLCQGQTCYTLVARIISEMTGKSLGEILPQRKRAPLRPLQLDVLAADKNDRC